jgi:hypothetical protein
VPLCLEAFHDFDFLFGQNLGDNRINGQLKATASAVALCHP